VFFQDCEGEVVSVAASWTDLGVKDAFVAISAGRSVFRVEDLLALSVAVMRVWDERREAEQGNSSETA
jgi:hypothetical protein